jgi:hypothetical protein
MSKLFVRERINVGRGAGLPRFAVVAVEGTDLKVYHSHIRRAELEKIATDIGAEIVYLPRGEQGEEQLGGGGGHRRRHSGHRQDQD